jgi:hypothetical protein
MNTMTTAREQMRMIDEKIERIKGEIARLNAQLEVLLELKADANGEPPPSAPRKRSPKIKPLVLDIMSRAGFAGATTADVDREVREKVPTVAKDTVGSILSRLKADGALTYDGERYFEKRFTPDGGGGLRAVS